MLFGASLFAIVLLRYLITAVSYRAILNRAFKSTVHRNTKTLQVRKEVRWSIASSVIFAVLSVITYYFFQHGYTQVYVNVSERSVVYFIASIPIFLILYESYYYWLHRWMHHPSIFKIVHRVHHESIEPTVFTSFSFHPLEAVLQFIFIPIAICIIPIHYYALGIVLMILTVSAVINHGGVEIFPATLIRHPIGKWLIGSTHHDLHHKEFRTNFGLYLTIWDKMMKTENQSFEKQFERNKERISLSQSPRHRSTDGQRR